jgi:protein HIRA/HIR1
LRHYVQIYTDVGYLLLSIGGIVSVSDAVYWVFIGTMKVVTARLSKSGAPLIVLANRHAFVFHLTMCCWLRIADDSFPASHFVTTWPETANSANNGELASLQAGVARAAGPSFLWNRLLGC